MTEAGSATSTTAAVLRGFGAPHRIEEVALRAPGPFEARVRITRAGVCHSDVGQADGEWSATLPLVLGHEGAGIVEAVGAGVEVPPGTRVVLNMAPGCGSCRACAAGRPILCQPALDAMSAAALLTGPSPFRAQDGPIGTYALLGCFARHVVVSARSLMPLPDDVPDEVGALLGCAVITGVGAAIETSDIAAGSRGAVIGVGGVGMSAVQGARARGAADVIAIDAATSRLDLAAAFGATRSIRADDRGLLDGMVASARLDGLDWTIATVGAPDAMRLAIDLLRPGGTACIVGLAREDHPVPVDMLDLVTFEKRIVGSAYGSLAPTLLVPRIIELYRAGLLRLDELVTETFPLEAIDEAFARSRGSAGLRPVLEMA